MQLFDYGNVWVGLMWMTPMLLVHLIGLLVALVTMGRHPARSWCVLLALFGSLITLLGLYLFWQLGAERLFQADIDPDLVDFTLRAAEVAPRLLHPLWITLLLLAVFVGRGKAAATSTPPAATTQYAHTSYEQPSHRQTEYGQPGSAATQPAPASGYATPPGYATPASHAAPTPTPRPMPQPAPAATPLTKPVKRLSKGFYFVSIYGGTLLALLLMVPGIIILLNDRNHDAPAGMLFVCAAYVPLLYSTIVGMVLIYKMWAAIQEGPARTTPGKAVGFLFIPLFNIYWMFQAYWGWTVDYNKLVAEKQLDAPRVPEGVALMLCIFSLCSMVPFVGILLALASLVLAIVFLNSAINGVNRLAALSPTVPAEDYPLM